MTSSVKSRALEETGNTVIPVEKEEETSKEESEEVIKDIQTI